jgi:hypothetical protein
MHERTFLAANGIRALMLGNPAFAMAVKAIYECFKHLKNGGSPESLAEEKPKAPSREGYVCKDESNYVDSLYGLTQAKYLDRNSCMVFPGNAGVSPARERA